MFNICAYSGFSGFLEPDPNVVKLHPGLIERTEVIERVTMPTRRLDDIAEIERIDLLKIDVQGAELDVFRHARDKLSTCVVVHTEVTFMPFYKNQPSFGEIDVELRGQGFVFHTAPPPKLFEFNGIAGDANQFIDGDMIYVRDFTRPELMSVDQLEALALIVERCYGSFGLARLCREHIALR